MIDVSRLSTGNVRMPLRRTPTRTPLPSLKYYCRHTDFGYTLGDVALANVYDVSVSVDRNDALYAVVSGQLLKKNGQPGNHRRNAVVDLAIPQPAWLAYILQDAYSRLYQEEA